MTTAEAKKLKVGDRIHWEVPENIAGAQKPSDGTVIDVDYTRVQIMWDDKLACVSGFDNTGFWACCTKLEDK